MRTGASLVAAGTILAGAGGSVLAHPSGEFGPPTARLSAEGRTVTIELSAPPDDAAAIGTAIGLLPEDAMEAFLLQDEAAQPTAEQIREVSTSPDLRAYLLEHVGVRQHGQPCPGEARPAEDFLADGADLRFTCEDPVEVVDVRITVLHDLDPRYAIFGLDGTMWTVRFTAAQSELPWDATAAGSGSWPFALLASVGGVLVGLAVVGRVLARRRRSSAVVAGSNAVDGIADREAEGLLGAR
ncbi:MAG: hypothetical protein LC679_15880 [Intrasporangiaceae bacterium]|nr:hypothetical protein [Intrasporangiaceae bacterium]